MTILTYEPNRTLKGHKLLIVGPMELPQSQIDDLRAEFPDMQVSRYEVAWATRNTSGIIPDEDWKDVTILLTSGNILPRKELAPKLQYVQLFSAGADHVLQSPLFTETDIAFCTANGVHGPQISEWLISTFLAFKHHLPEYLQYQREGRWNRSGQMVEDSVGETVGILGYGAIGRQTARVATALGMKVHAYTLHPRPTPESRHDDTYAPPGLGDADGKFPAKWFSGGSTEDVHAFLASGLDFLVLSAPLTAKTRHMISGPEFDVLSERGTFVANISRGPVIDTDALVEALNDGRIKGAALDVTDPEPLPEGHPLWSAKNIIITPHVSGMSTSYGKRVLAILQYNLERFSKGKELTNKINRKEGY